MIFILKIAFDKLHSNISSLFGINFEVLYNKHAKIEPIKLIKYYMIIDKSYIIHIYAFHRTVQPDILLLSISVKA